MKVIVAIGWLWAIAFICGFMRICKKPVPKLEGSDYYRRACDVAGAKYVGIQEVEGGDDLVLFNSPKTGSTLAVKEKDFTVVAVENRLEAHNAN
jgi:hypothetical protein